MKNILVEAVKETILKHNLIDKGDSVLLGVSGGPDSLAMLYILNELKSPLNFKISVATFDHGLRKESTNEVDFVKSIASNLGVTFFTKRGEVRKTAKNKSMSIQEAARTERLSFLFELKNNESFTKIALAHTMDDQIETIILHLLKGTGTAGLVGIKPKSFGGIIHPLLEIRKKDILSFLNENNLTFVQDKTNLDTMYERNKIRLQLLPLIESFNPSFKNNLISTSIILQDEDDYLERLSSKDLEFIKTKDRYLKVIFNNLPLFEKRRILKTIFGKQSTFDQIERAVEFLNSDKRKLNLTNDRYLISDKRFFWIEEQMPFSIEKEFEIAIPGKTRIPDADIEISAELMSSLTCKIDNFNVAFDLNDLALPLKARFRKEGDFINTENGTKKVQDIFVDGKVKRDERFKIPIVVDRNEKLLWIVGFRRCAEYKITDKSSKILLLRVLFNKK